MSSRGLCQCYLGRYLAGVAEEILAHRWLKELELDGEESFVKALKARMEIVPQPLRDCTHLYFITRGFETKTFEILIRIHSHTCD